MERGPLLGLVAALGKAFSRRGMTQHVRLLRIYYWALEKGLTSPAHELNVRWSEGFVIEWLKTLRVPPYDAVYSVHPRGAPCPSCGQSGGAQGAVNVDVVFPGGARVRCQSCETAWIQDDQPEPVAAAVSWRDRRTRR